MQTIPLTNANILVIDDTPDNLRLLEAILSKHYQVRLAPNGELGLEAARFSPPDLILLDVMMPDPNGYEVANQLKADPRTKEIPIIFISALNDSQSKIRGFEVGGVDYITKPFQALEILARVRTHLMLHDLYQQAQNEIAERKRAEENLRASETKLAAIFNNSRDAIGVYKDGVHVLVNPAFARLFGYERPGEVVGLPLVELIPPESRERVTKYYGRRSHPNAVPNLYECQVQRQDKSTFWVEIALSIYELNGEAYELAILRDVTERKEAHTQLTKSEANLQEAHSIARMGRWELNIQSGHMEWSQGIYELLEVTPQQISPSFEEFKRFIHPDDLWLCTLAGLQAINENPYRRIAHRIVLHDGKMKWVNQICRTDYNSAGDPIRVVSIMQDITEIKLAEEKLRLQSTALEAVANAIVITDQQSKIVWVNPAFSTLTGYTREEVVGAYASILKSGKHSRQFYNELWAKINHGEIWRGQVVNRHKSGSLYNEEMTITPLQSANGVITNFIAIKQDISQRIQAETELRQFADQQAALYAVTAASTSLLKPQQLLDTTLDVIIAIPHLHLSCGWVLLFEDESNQVRIGAARNLSQEFLQAEVDGTHPLCPLWTRVLSPQATGIELSYAHDCSYMPHELLEQENLLRYASIPLKIGKKVFGILNLGWSEEIQHDENMLSLLNSIGQQVSLALHNAKLYQEALQTDRLKTIHQIASQISASIELDIVFENLLAFTVNALQGKHGYIMLYQPETNELVFKHILTKDQGQGLREKRVNVGDGLIGWVAKHRQTALTNDAQSDPRWHHNMNNMGLDVRSAICAPLIRRDELVGVFEITDHRGEGFTPEHAELLDAIAPIAAVAIENARLFTATRQRAEELDALLRIGSEITSSLDTQVIVSNSLGHVQKLLKATYVGLLRPGPDGRTLNLVQARCRDRLLETATVFHPDEAYEQAVLQRHNTIFEADLVKNPQTFTTAGELVGESARAWLAIPLAMTERVIGVLEIASDQPGLYTPDDLPVLQSISSIMSVALENARLYENLKQLILERRRAQAHLLQTEKIIALGRLTATIAHEINNPLQAIQGCLGLFFEEMADKNRPEKLKRYLATVESEIERIAIIVRRMRDFYRPARIGLQSIQLAPVLQSVLELTHKQLQHNDITVSTEWEENLPEATVNTDHLKQVFLNLILNAIDAMPEGGELRVAIHLASLFSEEGVAIPALNITFADSGMGIPADILPRLSEPFFTTKPNGTGLGLYISYDIIHAYNGKIEVRSQPGQGTTFELYLPVTGSNML